MWSSSWDLSGIVKQVERWIGGGVYPGAGLIIGSADEVVLERYWGSHGPDSDVFIASAGKWLAAAAIAALVDGGALRWEDTVVDWLPEFAGDAGHATLRQLLSHTSGLHEQQPLDRHIDDYQTLAESVAHIVPLPLRDPPGARFRYGGLGMQVAGRMAELAAGERFEALFHGALARPLGMLHTQFTPVDSAPGHNPMLGGGARSTARDYARFLSMIAAGGVYRGTRALSVAAIEELERDQVGGAALEPDELAQRLCAGRRTGVYGLGLWRERVDADGRATRVSSPSWAGTYPWIDRTRGVYGVFVAHVDLAGPAWAAGFQPLQASPMLSDGVAAAVDFAAATRRELG